jgi:micrococcal nuclease
MEGLHNYRISKVVSVYDGDTITVDIDLGFNMIMRNQKLRLYGINTPEVRGEEKEEGKKVRDFVRELLLDNDDVWIKSYKDKSGKYGRWLATVYYKIDADIKYNNLNNLLIELDMAIEYMKK